MATVRSKYYPLWRLLFATGLRRGEALGLRWGDIDTEQRLITVRRSLQSHSRAGNYHFGPPKTPRSRRTISVDPDTLDILDQWRSRQRREFDQLGINPDTTTSVFTTVRADPMLPSVVSDSWRAAVARVGLPAMRLHSVRHTHLSHLLRAGEPIQNVASRAGHGSPYMTLTTYAFVIPGDDERTAQRAAGLFHIPERQFTATEPNTQHDPPMAKTD
jgi:integrase